MVDRRQHTEVEKLRGRKAVVTTVKIDNVFVCCACCCSISWVSRIAPSARVMASAASWAVFSEGAALAASDFKNPESYRVVSILAISLDIKNIQFLS